MGFSELNTLFILFALIGTAIGALLILSGIFNWEWVSEMALIRRILRYDSPKDGKPHFSRWGNLFMGFLFAFGGISGFWLNSDLQGGFPSEEKMRFMESIFPFGFIVIGSVFFIGALLNWEWVVYMRPHRRGILDFLFETEEEKEPKSYRWTNGVMGLVFMIVGIIFLFVGM